MAEPSEERGSGDVARGGNSLEIKDEGVEAFQSSTFERGQNRSREGDSFPTNTKLYHRMRIKLVREAKACSVDLCPSYTRKSKWSLIMQDRYAHAHLMKHSRKEIRKLKT